MTTFIQEDGRITTAATSDAPERIWAGIVDGFGGWHEAPDLVNNTPYILATPEALAASPEVAALIAEARREDRAKWDAHRRAQDKRIRMQREELRWMHAICQGVHMASASIASGYRKQREELEALKKETP